jgi:hypothetical protein
MGSQYRLEVEGKEYFLDLLLLPPMNLTCTPSPNSWSIFTAALPHREKKDCRAR